MLKKSLFLTTLLTLNPAVFAEEEINNEQIVVEATEEEQIAPCQEDVNQWNMTFSFKASSFTQENWETVLEKINRTVEEANKEDNDISPIEATLNLLKELFALSTNDDEFTATNDDKAAIVSFTMNKLNDEDPESWEQAQSITQEIAQELNETGKVSFETFAPQLHNLVEVISNSTSIQGNIFMGVSPDKDEAATKQVESPDSNDEEELVEDSNPDAVYTEEEDSEEA